MNAEGRRACPSCGNEFSGAMEFCPVCMLRKALAGGVESGESSSEDTGKQTSEHATQRFEHYELVKSEDGKPLRTRLGSESGSLSFKTPVRQLPVARSFLMITTAAAKAQRGTCRLAPKCPRPS